jgi:Peptidase M15
MATITLPSGEVVDLLDPVLPGGNFFWYEVTNGGDRQRIPKSQDEMNGILAMARGAEQVRGLLAEAMIIDSWFRPEPINSNVGGAPNSLHIPGRAIDFYCNNKSPLTVY